MKFNFKNISLVLVLVLAIGLLTSCSSQEAPQDFNKEDLTLNLGFSESKSVEDDKNYILLAVNGDTLRLEVEDDDLFNSLKEDEFYIFSFNKDNILRDIQTNSYIKDLVENSMKEGIDEDKKDKDPKEILAEDIISMDGLTLLDEYIIDFNDDGYDEVIAMYVAAGRDDNGEIMWDDGQRWALVVHGDNKDYLLYDDYVQLGSIEFNVFTEEDDFYIVTKSVRTASLTVTQYKYNESDDSFIKTIAYDIKGNVNMLHSSNY